ncbi:MAG: TRAP transporter large permease subunit [Streptosporangiales bacterium]|nr:TRAP transporter large permease subunit [Streptosporangiales bacterium]
MTIALLMVAVFVVLLVIGAPVYVSMGVAALVAFYFEAQAPSVITQTFATNINGSALTAIPFFLLMAAILSSGRGVNGLIDLLLAFVGHRRGGLALVAVLASAMLAAVSGSSPANAAALGLILVPKMTRLGYSPTFAAGLVAGGGTLGILIPPSINMIIYSSITTIPVLTLFRAGVLPGIVLTALLAAVSVGIARRRRYPVDERVPWSGRLLLLRKHGVVLLLPIFIYVVILLGIVTATESAMAGVIGALLIEGVYYRKLTWRKLVDACASTLRTSVIIFLIIATASMFSYVLTIEQVPQSITTSMGALVEVSPVLFIIVVSLLLVVLGDFLDVAAITYLVIPIVDAILIQHGLDRIQFAILFILNMELALVTPPVGINCFVLSNLTKLPVSQVTKGTLPFAACVVTTMLLVGIFPELTLNH